MTDTEKSEEQITPEKRLIKAFNAIKAEYCLQPTVRNPSSEAITQHNFFLLLTNTTNPIQTAFKKPDAVPTHATRSIENFYRFLEGNTPDFYKGKETQTQAVSTLFKDVAGSDALDALKAIVPPSSSPSFRQHTL